MESQHELPFESRSNIPLDPRTKIYLLLTVTTFIDVYKRQVISIIAMFSMMGGKNAKLMAEYQAAQDRMTKAGTEYVRGIPVVKIFQQTVYSFKAFQQAIEEYSSKAEHYQSKVCRVPQSVNLTLSLIHI